MTGFPVIDGIAADSSTIDVAEVDGSYFGNPPALATVNPGAMLGFFLDSGTGCGNAPQAPYSGLRVHMAESTTVDVFADVDPTCGFSVSAWGDVSQA